jgi:hypothetical protein
MTKDSPVNCCHVDFAVVEGSDQRFTVGMPTFTFGAGVLREAGAQAQELGLQRVALFTDKTSSRASPLRRSGRRLPPRTSTRSCSTRFRSVRRMPRSKLPRGSPGTLASTARFRRGLRGRSDRCGGEPQYRVIRNAPVDVGRDELKTLFRSALHYWQPAPPHSAPQLHAARAGRAGEPRTCFPCPARSRFRASPDAAAIRA